MERAADRNERAERSWNLVAGGAAGGTRVEVDRTTAAPEEWSLTIARPGSYVRFRIPGPLALSDLHCFLHGQTGRAAYAEQPAGDFGGSEVVMVKDPQSPDRFLLRVWAGGHLIESAFPGPDAADLSAALVGAIEQLERR
jgi:hypothetical protein